MRCHAFLSNTFLSLCCHLPSCFIFSVNPVGGQGGSSCQAHITQLLAANTKRKIIHKSKPHLLRFTTVGRYLSEQTEASRITWKELGNNSVAANTKLLVIWSRVALKEYLWDALQLLSETHHVSSAQRYPLGFALGFLEHCERAFLQPLLS